MKRLKKFMSVVLALCCAITMTLSVSMNVSAVSDEDLYTEIKDNLESINTSKLYYDKNTGKFYIRAIKSKARGIGNAYDIWLYELNDKGIAKETNRLEYSCYMDDKESHFSYSINFKECSIDEFYKQYKSFDDKYTEIDAEQGMSELDIKDTYSSNTSIITTTSSTDYSYVSNITLDIGTSQKLLPKVILNEKDNLKITWSSSDDNVATVDNDGNVTAKNSGSCTVSAKLEGLDESIEEYTIRVRTNDEILKTAAMQFAKEQEQYYALADIDNDGENELIIIPFHTCIIGDQSAIIDIYKYKNNEFEKISSLEDVVNGNGRHAFIKLYNNELYTIAISLSVYNMSCGYNAYVRKYENNEFKTVEEISYSALLDGNTGKPMQGDALNEWIKKEKQYDPNYEVQENTYHINGKESTFEEVENEIDTVLKQYENYPDLIFTPYDAQPSDYIFFDSDVRYLTDNEVKKLDSTDIKYAINEIYARHGYIFKDEELRNYFHEKSWYSGSVEDVNSIQFNSYEDENLKLLAKYRQ